MHVHNHIFFENKTLLNAKSAPGDAQCLLLGNYKVPPLQVIFESMMI
jgi:hypothetical protein